MRPPATSVLVFFCACTLAAQPSPLEPLFGFAAGDHDPHAMLRRHVVRRVVEALEQARLRREEAIRGSQVPSFGRRVREALRASLGDMPFAAQGGPLNARLVSRHDRVQYRIENVLFDSLPGWEVNATVYLPADPKFPPPWPAIVVPVGHSGKQFADYQIPPQIFARSGFIAVTFDPPGQAGEKQPGNDHFRDGVRCYLTGATSQRFFVLDALRVIDYLATRRDVDMTRGVGMTGVSGGGFTTLYATLLDERIKASGPSCFGAPEAFHPVRNAYAPCPETLHFARYRDGLDTPDLLLAAHPTPLLMMAGRDDEVFRAEWSQALAESTARGYEAGGAKDRFCFFLDSSGHAYTIAQAYQFVGWMDRWIRGTPSRELPRLTRADVELAPYDLLQCRPSPEQNMLTITRSESRRLAQARSHKPLEEAVLELAGVDRKTLANLKPLAVEASRPFQVWFHHMESLRLKTGTDIETPASFLYDIRHNVTSGAILYFDEDGRDAQLRSGGMLAAMARFTQREGHRPALMTVDLRGWGDTEPAMAPYEIAGWGAPHRWLAYVSAALGDPVISMRIRDALASLAYLRSRPEIDPDRIVIGGNGMGGVVALHLAAVDKRIRGVFVSRIPASFEALASADKYLWSHDAFFPRVLAHYDLPELAAGLGCPALIVNPLDPMKQPLTKDAAKSLYAVAGRTTVQSGLDASAAQKLQQQWVASRW